MYIESRSIGEKVFNVFNIIVLSLIAFATLYPFVFIISSSFSNTVAILKQEVFLWPVGFNLDSYKMVFSSSDILTAYYNTIWYTVVGTAISVLLTAGCAYPLSRKTYSMRSPIMLYIAVTMFFSGGLIPFFLLITQLGMYDTRWAIVIPGAVSAWNLIIARVFLQTTIPDELTEAACIDGANEVVIFFKIVLPLSLPIIAVLSVFYGVGHWNNFFGPLIFLSNDKLFPLSLYLRRILITGARAYQQTEGFVDTLQSAAMAAKVKNAAIVVTILPIICVYPFLQKYFVKGMMIGAIKE